MAGIILALLMPASLAIALQQDSPIVLNELRPKSWDGWSELSGRDFDAIKDDDIQRHAGDPDYFSGISIDEWYFRENGFAWHLLRFTNSEKPTGPLWMVPHDDENAAFDGAIDALRQHGGIVLVVNSGPGSARRQAGNGKCGVRAEAMTSCDPNRNFAATSPKFTEAFLSQRPAGQPVIALHTNSPGFSGDSKGGRGEITIIDRSAYQRGAVRVRRGGILAVNPTELMANYDTLGLTAYLARDGQPDAAKARCGQKMANAGVHFWHERVDTSDGSMSNYLALTHPEIAYFNAESRAEVDLAIAAARHKIMIDAYLSNCAPLGNQPAP